jgi:hypothetical protein
VPFPNFFFRHFGDLQSFSLSTQSLRPILTMPTARGEFPEAAQEAPAV